MFFWINKRLFPKSKPHNQRIHEPKAQKKRKTDRTSPKTKEKATARNNQQQPRTTTQKTKHTSTTRKETPQPKAQPIARAKATKAQKRPGPNQQQTHQYTKRTTKSKDIKREGPSLTHSSVHWIVHHLLET